MTGFLPLALIVREALKKKWFFVQEQQIGNENDSQGLRKKRAAQLPAGGIDSLAECCDADSDPSRANAAALGGF